MKTYRFLIPALAVGWLLATGESARPVAAQSAAQLLKEGTYYQGQDDTTDRAADRYRAILSRYPKSKQAEQAQFYLGTYYQKKFYILESTAEVQDWSSFNQAEDALRTYVAKYAETGSKAYLADAYHTLGVISIRRGNYKDAQEQLRKMIDASPKDPYVYVYKMVWSPYHEDIIKSVCDSKGLALATLKVTEGDMPFGGRMRWLRDWCRMNCKKSL